MVPDSQPSTGWSLIRRLFREHRSPMLLLGFTSFAGALLEAAFMILLTATLLSVAAGKSVIGPFGGHSVGVWAALGLAVGAAVARFALAVIGVSMSSQLSARVRQQQRNELGRSYLGAAWEVQEAQPSGRLQELVTGFVMRVNLAVTAATSALTAALSLLALIGASFVLQPLASLAVVSVLVVLVAILAPLRRRIRRHAEETSKSDLAFAAAVAEYGSLPLEMHTFGVRAQITQRLEALIQRATTNQRRVMFLNGLLTPTYTLVVYLAILAGVGALASLDLDDLTSVGAVMLLMLRSMTFGQSLTTASGVITASTPALQQIERTLADYRDQAAPSGTVHPSALTPIVVRDVSYSYRPDRPALDGVSLTITRSSALGVIGPSGSGKSSLAHLLLGLRRPDSGQILVDGVDLGEVDRNWWSTRVAFVPQHAQLFTGTVAENIRFFRDDISDSDVRSAAERANILADIERLPHGFDTHLGQRGGELSGGQKQRLSIARAFAGDPELIILDEPTSALDPESEALIRDTLTSMHGHLALVVIAHRMSTLNLCDTLLVMDSGRVAATGSPAHLREDSAFYRRALELAGLS